MSQVNDEPEDNLSELDQNPKDLFPIEKQRLSSVRPEISSNEQSQYAEKTQAYKLKGREKYGSLIPIIVIVWLSIVVVIIISQGFSIGNFFLSDGALIALISGVSINVVGLFYIVIRFIFSE